MSQAEPSCDTCAGSGWVPVEDPLIDALVDARCPTCDLANVWRDFGWWVQPDGTRRLLSWNAATHELKFWALNPLTRHRGELILAVIPTEEEVVRRLECYDAYCDTKEGLSWLAQRLEGCR